MPIFRFPSGYVYLRTGVATGLRFCTYIYVRKYERVKFVLFADDTNIFCSNENIEVLQDTLNRELAQLFVWFSINKLSLNLGKTNYMLFRSRPPDLELHLKINNADIPKTKVTATKFLGIIIDDRLNWKPHIQSVKSKLSCILSIMYYKASKLITTAGMYTLYCSLFQLQHTAMNYGVILMLQM